MTKPSAWAKQIADEVEIVFTDLQGVRYLDHEETSKNIARAVDKAAAEIWNSASLFYARKS